MNTGVARLATNKESLLMRSAMCRLRLRRDSHDLRTALQWKRTARFALVAGRIVLAVKLTRSLVGLARRFTRPRAP